MFKRNDGPSVEEMQFGLRRAEIQLGRLENDVVQMDATKAMKVAEIDRLNVEIQGKISEQAECRNAIAEIKEKIEDASK